MKKYYHVVYTLTNIRENISTQIVTLYATEGIFIPAKFSKEEEQVVGKEMQTLGVIPMYVNTSNMVRITPTFWTEITEEEAKSVIAYGEY